MKVVFLLALIVFVNSGEIKSDRGVQVLEKDTFKTFVNDNKHVLVQFCAPVSHNCKLFDSEYTKAAAKLSDLNVGIKLAKVDATEQAKLAKQYNIYALPTLKFFRDGKPSDYNDGLTGVEIVHWLLHKTGQAAKLTASAAKAKKFVSVSDVVVLGLFKDLDSNAAKQFSVAAQEVDELFFDLSSDELVLKQYGVSGDSAIILLNGFNNPMVELKGDITSEAIIKFVKSESVPLVIEFDRESSVNIFSGESKDTYILHICAGKNHEEIEQIKSAANKGAKAFEGKVLFITVDTDDVAHQPMLDFYGMKKSELPAMLLIHHSSVEDITNKYKHALSEGYTEKNIQTFVQTVLDGKLKPDLLSEEMSEDWDKNPVKKLVSKNFDQVVFDTTKDVLVEFYVPNRCEQCKRLAPIYEELAEMYKNDAGIVIAKMNSMANELEHTKITRFPTFKLYQKGDNNVITFKGSPTLEGFSEFIDPPSKKKSVFREL